MKTLKFLTRNGTQFELQTVVVEKETAKTYKVSHNGLWRNTINKNELLTKTGRSYNSTVIYEKEEDSPVAQQILREDLQARINNAENHLKAFNTALKALDNGEITEV